MDATILDSIPFALDFTDLQKKTRVKDGSPFEGELRELARQAEAIARPKACYLLGAIDAKEDRRVVVEGVAFTSRVLRVNLGENHRVFPFVATCGVELQAWGSQLKDMLYSFWADAIQQMAVQAAFEHLRQSVQARYRLDGLSEMSPGSLEDWPISEQTPLFMLLGELVPAVGVELTESLLMVPIKTISGVLFPSEENFESCQLCPRPKCPGRRAAYDPNLYERKYKE